MASDFLTIDRSKVHGNKVVEIADALIKLRAGLASEFGSASHMFAGSDYTSLELHFGLQPGTGPNFLSLLGLMYDILVGTAEVSGAARRSQLDEFTARIGGQ